MSADAGTPALSVVLACTGGLDSIATTVRHLAAQSIRARMELVVVGLPSQAGAPPPPAQAEPSEQAPEDGERVAVDDPNPPREYDEKDQATRQLLSRIPDDPGALLREKLRRRYLQRRYVPNPDRGW